jgi:lipoate-protein ligase A
MRRDRSRDTFPVMTVTRIAEISATQGVLAGRWRLLLSPPRSGAANMAMDDALMTRARRTGERVLRVYTWSEPTLSLGRHQAARERIDPDVARALGVSLVRRPTGGRALLHHREVTYSVTAPLARDESVRAWYEATNAVLLRALRALGVRAESAAADGRTPLPASASCFVRPDDGEITVGGRKLVGSALLRQKDALLQHGSILIDDDQGLLDQLLPSAELRPAPAGTLRQALGAVPSFGAVADALLASLEGSGDVDVSPLEPDDSLLADVRDAERIYGSEEWTFRQ